ncbi:hypothetical protein QFC21_000265 [Naganishia friedmannii]|uniref:Uncharacterized protein n=1 Tax=Naganishia friedmannii TaxID=89922 RepID=A0ACC2WBU7_9TREE|nr:hypothetical protein QFC21_000265 [Naganishia friedmannii]
MNFLAPSAQPIYREASKGPGMTSDHDIEAWDESQKRFGDDIYNKARGRLRHFWRQPRSSIALALGTIAVCGVLTCIYWRQGFKHSTDARLEEIEPQDQSSSKGAREIPLVSSPTIGLLKGTTPLQNNDFYLQVRSDLGLMAERSYVHGPRNLDDYRSSLATFINVAMPEELRPILHSGLIRYTDNGDRKVYLQKEYNRLLGVGEDPRTRRIWQMDPSPDYANSEPAASWKNHGENWEWKLLKDTDSSLYVRKHLTTSRLRDVWNLLPNGWLRTDMLRYLTLLLHGGISSESDTKLIKPISAWENGTALWQKGRGWLNDHGGKAESGERENEHHKATGMDELSPPSIVVGIAVDVKEREDWQKLARQPLQIAEWTIASTPYHPIILDTIRYMTHHAVESTEERFRRLYIVQWLLARGEKDMAKQIGEKDQKDPQIWRGTSSFTDAVLR